MTNLNEYVNNILNEELNKNTSNKLINYIDEDINFKYNLNKAPTEEMKRQISAELEFM